MGELRIGDLAAAPGTKVSGYLDAVELVDGTFASLPVQLLNGVEDGPTLFLGAGAHGDEINGVKAVMDAVAAVDVLALRGRIVAVPVQNPIAYRARFRLITLNQLDRQNMHRCFPGAADGDIPARLCNAILDTIIGAADVDFVVDCHTGSTGSYYPPLTFVSTQGAQGVVERSLAGARAFGADLIVKAGGKAGVYALSNMLHMVAVERGIPAFGCELGTALPAEREQYGTGARGLRNLMIHLGMVEGERTVVRSCVELDEIVEVRSERGGICDYLVQPGQPVEKGQPIARIINLFGDEVDEVSSPITGHVVTCTYWGTINQGERLVRIGRAQV